MQFAEMFCAQIEGGQPREVGCDEVYEVVGKRCGELSAYKGGVQKALIVESLWDEGCRYVSVVEESKVTGMSGWW